jgi:ADP-ribose pyrophosphatase YjhB (NUDIX family)
MKDRRRYPSRPMVGAGAVVFKGGEVLLVKRRYPPNRGKWALPGGLVELGEVVQDAAVREVEEETGLRVKILGLLDVQSDLHRDKKGMLEYHYILVDYLATSPVGEVSLNDESSNYGWFTEAKAMRLRMSAGTRTVLHIGFKQRLR